MTASGRTVAAILTPLAPGAIAVISMHGVEADAIASKLLRKQSSHEAPSLPPNRPVYCRLVDGDQTIDDVVAMRIADAHLDHRIEINTHGGVRIAQRALMLFETAGAEIVPGLDYLAMLQGDDRVRHAIDLALVRAESRRLTQWLLAQREILPGYLDELAQISDDERLAFEQRSHVAEHLLRGIRIAVIGQPNAGKSTLANRFIGKDRVITSDEAGTTRDWISETALLDGWPVTLTDTAGLRETTCHIEREAIRRAREQAGAADVILIVLDATRRDADWRAQLLSIAPEDFARGTPRVVAINKCDEIKKLSTPADVPAEVVCISALHGDGIDQLQARLCELLDLHLLRDDLPTAIDRSMLVNRNQ